MNKTGIKRGALVVVLLGTGWFLRGLLMPGGGPGGPGGPGGSGGPGGPGGMEMPPPTVRVQPVRLEPVQPERSYIATVEPLEQVLILSEVSGYIDEVHFTEGGRVERGDLLFTIDRRKYQAAADAAEAELTGARKRYDRMRQADERSVSRTDLETAESAVQLAEARFRQARVVLDYTRITAPVSGRIGAALQTRGNYVTSASGPLAHIVRMDPVRVVFSLTDREYLTLRQQELEGAGAEWTAHIRLPSGLLLPRTGKKDFDDNRINPETGTLAVRYLFDNPDGLLVPGGYVTAVLHGREAPGIKIPQRALLTDARGSYVLALDEEDRVSAVRIETGPQVGPDVVVLAGLESGVRIVVDGLQKAQPGSRVVVVNGEATP